MHTTSVFTMIYSRTPPQKEKCWKHPNLGLGRRWQITFCTTSVFLCFGFQGGVLKDVYPQMVVFWGDPGRGGGEGMTAAIHRSEGGAYSTMERFSCVKNKRNGIG